METEVRSSPKRVTVNNRIIIERLVVARLLLPLLLQLTIGVHAQFAFVTNNGALKITGYAGPDGIAVTIPNTIYGMPVVAIGDNAFAYASGFPSITIGNNVTNIGMYVFTDCLSLTTITVDGLNPAFSSMAGVLFDKNQTKLIQYPAGKAGSYLIPDSVTCVGSSAFSHCRGLIDVTFGMGVTNIEDHAFQKCRGLTCLTIPNSVTSIGTAAFDYCNALTNLTVSESISYIPSRAFSFCGSLTHFTIPDSATGVGSNAFVYCLALSNIIVGKGITNLSYGAFSYCENLAGIYFKSNAPTLGSSNVFVEDLGSVIYYLPGTAGWDVTFAGRPTALWKPKILTSDSAFGLRTNQFGFNISWASGMALAVDACTNPANPVWTPLQTNTLTSDTLYFSDPQWTNHPARFYRLRWP